MFHFLLTIMIDNLYKFKHYILNVDSNPLFYKGLLCFSFLAVSIFKQVLLIRQCRVIFPLIICDINDIVVNCVQTGS